MIKRLLMILSLFIAIPLTASAAEAPALKGSYTKLPGHQYKFDGKTVEVLEFLSFYCGSCYAFEKSVPVIKGNFPKKIKWKIVPLYWGEGSPKPGEAYLLAEEAGKGEQMKKALFNANFVEKKDIGKIEVLESIGSKIGLGFDYSRKLRTGDKAKEAQKALDMARVYSIEETPTLVIAGNLMTNPHAFDHNMDALKDNVITIIKGILNQ
ncbi:MAG: DsbA family protein [Deltaproteobacteria bacterium]|nr:DsbA family protein [Deltaproteobacteria bacterium]